MNTILDPRQYSPKEFLAQAESLGLNKFNALPFLGAVIGRGILDPQVWSEESLISKKMLSELAPLPSLKIEKIVTSEIDGFQKILFKTADHLSLETVIIPLHKEGSVSICLSSQVGCVMACTFCATARMTDRRNLKSWEIIDQLQQARRIVAAQGRKITGVVFMGMGEPLLNYDNVMKAAEHFCYPVINAISSKAITVSTVGVLDKIHRFIDEKRPFRLSISIGAATDEKRAKLVPVAARTPLKELVAAGKRYALQYRQRINLAYVCISGENMFDDDARALADLLKDTPVRLDLIEVTDTTGRYQKPTEEEFKKFRSLLCDLLKQPVVRRYSGGADIAAACGTLAGSA